MHRNRSRRGSALLLTLVIVILVAGVGGAFFVHSTYSFQRQHTAIQADEAQIVCDANLERVRNAMFKYERDATWTWDQILAYCDQANTNAGGNVDNWVLTDLAVLLDDYENVKGNQDFTNHLQNSQNRGYYTQVDAPLPANPTSPSPGDQTLFARTMPFAKGGVYIVIRDNDDGDGDNLVDSDNQVVVTITATFEDTTQRQIETLIRLNTTLGPPVAGAGIRGNGNGDVSGNATITGTNGSIHLNGDFEISGNPTVEQNATAGGSFTVSGSPTINGISGGGQPLQQIPPIVPQDYKASADYIFTTDGKVVDQLGNLHYDENVGNGGGPVKGFQGWEFNGSGWQRSGNNKTPDPQTLYFEAPNPLTKDYYIKISGNPGTKDDPLLNTIISEGSVEISGNPSLGPDPGRNDNVAIVTGADLKISGNPNNGYFGDYYVHEQFTISGNPNLTGTVTVEDAANVQEIHKETAVKISGNPDIHIPDPGAVVQAPPVPTDVELINYRRIK